MVSPVHAVARATADRCKWTIHRRARAAGVRQSFGASPEGEKREFRCSQLREQSPVRSTPHGFAVKRSRGVAPRRTREQLEPKCIAHRFPQPPGKRRRVRADARSCYSVQACRRRRFFCLNTHSRCDLARLVQAVDQRFREGRVHHSNYLAQFHCSYLRHRLNNVTGIHCSYRATHLNYFRSEIRGGGSGSYGGSTIAILLPGRLRFGR